MRSAFTTTLALTAVLLAMPAHAQGARDLSRTIDNFNDIPAVRFFVENAYGYAVFRRISRGARDGTATGRGQVYVDGEVTGFSRIVDFAFGGGSNDTVYSQIIFFEDKATYDDFAAGGVEFDAQANTTPVSIQRPSSTQGDQASVQAASSELAAESTYHKGMRVFTMEREGSMRQMTIAGQRYDFRPLR